MVKLPRTKIIATIGPASDSQEAMKKLIIAGVNVFRINFSHGTYDDYLRSIKNIRKLSSELDKPVSIMCDFQGPKLRVGVFKERGGVTLARGQKFIITHKEILGTKEKVSGPFPNFYEYVSSGDKIYLNDGLLKLSVTEIKGKDVHCKVLEGGPLSDHKGINLPSSKKQFSVLTPKDKRDIDFAMKQGLDLFAFSFIQTHHDVERIREHLKSRDWEGLLICKIEKPEAVRDFKAILKLSDGILIARGDLGVEFDYEKVPPIQKDIIQLCNQNDKLVITATQMLETMVKNPVPTRAEVSDVANAVYDKSDAVMLSAETATGKYPLKTVKMMRKIADEVEKNKKSSYPEIYHNGHEDPTKIIASAATSTAEHLKAKAIVCHTMSGYTAKLLAKFHPSMPIIAFTPHEATFRKLVMYYAVYPILLPSVKNTDKMIANGQREAIKHDLCKPGDQIVIVAGEIEAQTGTNMMKIHVIDENLEE
ncbi:MAG: pyruvate kinase [Chlamydiota bacterium]